MKMSSRLWLMVGVVVGSLVLSAAEARGQNNTPTGTVEAISFFEEINRRWEQFIDPLARRQVVRRLRRLSNSLDDLASDKQDLAEAVLAMRSGDVAQQNTIRAQIREHQETVQRLRRNIVEFSSVLPASDRERGNRVANTLFEGFSEKWRILQRVQNMLNNGQLMDAAGVSRELSAAAQTLLRLKAEIGILIAQIENS
jgi:hypothetical protein